MKRINYRSVRAAALSATAILTIISTGCSSASAATQTAPESGNTSAFEVLSQSNTTAADSSWDNAASTFIKLDGTSAAVEGEGARADGSTVVITSGGTYVLSGSFTGSIVITAPDTDTVRLVLNGVTLTADKNAGIYCTQADGLILTLADGSVNTVSDAAAFTYADTTNKEPDAAIFSKVDLTVNGTGSLTVNAGYNNGIGTKDDLLIESGTVTITAANHGIRGRDSVTVVSGVLAITAGADGIQSNNDEDTAKGWIALEGGTYQINAGNDAIQAETALTVAAGTYSLISGGGNAVLPEDTTGSYKGLKAGTDLSVSGGTFTIDSADDAVHANGNILISGGSLTLSSGDDAVHADADMTIRGSETTIEVITSYEGLEALTMTIEDGIITVNATDDGINIAGGNDSGQSGRFGADNFRNGGAGRFEAGTTDTTRWLLISGGTITVKAGSDAIDINGNGEMTGGTVDLTAALLGEGQTLDVDGTWTQSGGDLTETGGNSMGGRKPGSR